MLQPQRGGQAVLRLRISIAKCLDLQVFSSRKLPVNEAIRSVVAVSAGCIGCSIDQCPPGLCMGDAAAYGHC